MLNEFCRDVQTPLRLMLANIEHWRRLVHTFRVIHGASRVVEEFQLKSVGALVRKFARCGLPRGHEGCDNNPRQAQAHADGRTRGLGKLYEVKGFPQEGKKCIRYMMAVDTIPILVVPCSGRCGSRQGKRDRHVELL